MRYFLGMKIAISKREISFFQRNSIINLFIKIGMPRCKPSDTPIEIRKKNEDMRTLVAKDRYKKLIEKLIYLSHIRPNIAFAVT